jgi:Rhodopirellula transposase DDE domain
MAAIAHLLQHETGGDPMQDLKWSRRAIPKIARQLRRLKIRVSATTVRRLLKQLGFSLRVNHKRLESGNKPPRRGGCATASLPTSMASAND